MIEADYIKHLDRVARSVTTKAGGEYLICGRQCRLYYPTGCGNIVAYVWLGLLTPDGLKPKMSFVAGPPISGSAEDVTRRLDQYWQALAMAQQVVDRLDADAVEWIEDYDTEDEEDIDDDDADADE